MNLKILKRYVSASEIDGSDTGLNQMLLDIAEFGDPMLTRSSSNPSSRYIDAVDDEPWWCKVDIKGLSEGVKFEVTSGYYAYPKDAVYDVIKKMYHSLNKVGENI